MEDDSWRTTIQKLSSQWLYNIFSVNINKATPPVLRRAFDGALYEW